MIGLGLGVWLAGHVAWGGVIDVWRASDLEASLAEGQPVVNWTSGLGRNLTTSNPDLRPVLRKQATPAGASAVRFNQNRLRNTSASGSPLGGLSSFSIALVFRADAVGSSGGQWYSNTGIIDAEQGGETADWGVVIDGNGQLGWGCGLPDQTLYSTGASLVDGNYHVAVVTLGEGNKGLYLDNLRSNSVSGVTTATRNSAGMAFGRILTDANTPFAGDLVEVRFYDAALDATEAAGVINELRDSYLLPGPIIGRFSASTNQILIGSPVTLSWGVTNAATVRLTPGPGAVGAAGNLQVFPRTNTTYTLAATNAQGGRVRQVIVAVDQGIPVASNQVVRTLKNHAVPITLAGSDPQGSNLTYAVVSPPTHGGLTGSGASRTYTPAHDFVGNDQFTFQVNDGEFASAPATVTIQVQAPPAAPTGITLSTTNIGEGTVPGAFIASLGVVDVNPEDTHTFALLPGAGDNSKFVLTGNQLRASDAFVGALGAQFLVSLRVTDGTGRSYEQAFTLTVTAHAQTVVINEVHYNPEQNTSREEFIELHNPSPVPVDISLWEISGGVDFRFPPGTVIPAGGFAVAAQAPATVQAVYGQAAFGPWSGNLSSQGEQLTLKNSSGKTVDTVDYRADFPWPIGADGEGASMALVNPGLDNDLGSSWRSEFPPTPGASNRVHAVNAPPNIRQVQHSPQLPTATNEITFTAKVTDPDGVAVVQLQYQLVSPGNYIPAVLPVSVNNLIANPALEPTINPTYTNAANWLSVPMVDNGTAGDAAANDGIYTAILPAQANRVLVRYRIVTTDALGASRRAPFEDDPSLNFACFVYNGVPAYQGVSAQALTSLPVYTLLSRAQDVTSCTAYNGADQLPQFSGNFAHLARFAFNWPGTLVYDGVVYDNIRYRLHGANGRYQPGKRNWRFKMNKGSALAARDQFGNQFPRKWSHLTAGKGANNRSVLTYSLNEAVNYFLWNQVGVPAPNTIFFHYRVVTGVQEAPSQYGGDFWGLNWAQEDYDGDYLEAHGLEKGNLYKLINASFSANLAEDMVGQQRYQGPFAVTNGTDGAALQNALLGNQSTAWILAHVNVDEWYRYHAVCEAIRHYDYWPDANKNAAWYFAPPYAASNDFHGQFWMLPWDTDSTWGATWNAGQDLVYNGIFNAGSHPELARDYANTVRHLRDLLFQPDQINPVIDAYAARLQAFIPADLARWANAPTSGGSYAALTAAAGFSSPGLTGGLAGTVRDMKNFMFTGGSYPWWLDRQTIPAGGWIQRLDELGNDSAQPNKPVLYYVGQSNYPMNSLTFECLPFADPQGAGSFAGRQWRLAEVGRTNGPVADARLVPPLEINALWESGTLSNGATRITLPAQYVQTNRVYRVRVRDLDNTGRWSHWSDPVQFSVSPADTLAVLRENLRFSEVMYNPPDFGSYLSDDLEYLELENTGTTNLSLDGLTFTAGITFTFPNNTTLAPGAHFLLARNATALQARYPGVVPNGIYSGKLDNGGETLRLSTPTLATVLELAYQDSPPWPVTADGMGWSLVWDAATETHYRASTAGGGSPRATDPVNVLPKVVLNEMLTRSDLPQVDFIELHNPTGTAADIGGWFLSDKTAVPKKFRIPPGTFLPPFGFLVFAETDYNTNGLDFNLNSQGDEVYLFSGDAQTNLTGYVHAATFGAAHKGVSFGRYVNSQGREDFVAMSAVTIGATNARPRVGPLVISEIMYRPLPVGTNENYEGEFLEVRNAVGTNVPLYSPAFPTNTAQLDNAVTFAFPTNVVLPPGASAIVVSFSPTNATALNAFRLAYDVPTNAWIFGPWSGRLDNAGEAVELKLPEPVEADGSIPYVLVDKVSYQAVTPWPEAASGTGQSLQRAALLAYGNDPVAWFAATPTVGGLAPQTSLDVDGDGLPDEWEFTMGLEPFTADGGEDPDGDGLSNYQEWRAGTEPRNAGSGLRLFATVPTGQLLTLKFEAVAGRAYQIWRTAELRNPEWQVVTNLAAAATNRSMVLEQPVTGTGFYRVVVP